jgi:hypothetical protein
MTAVIVSLLTLGAIDMLDPYGMTTTLMLLQLVRKDWHVLVKIWSAYFAYWLTSVGLYYGVTEYLLRYIHFFQSDFPVLIGIFQLIIGIIALLGAIILTIRLIRNWSGMGSDISKVIYFKSVHPLFLVGYSVVTVWSSIPTLWPLYSFISVLIPASLPMIAIVLLLGVFTLFSKIPQLLVYSLYKKLEAERFSRIMGGMKRVLSRALLIVIPIVLLLVAVWGLSGAFRNIWLPGYLHR